jgi:FkbM family methyltransferase
LRGGPGRKPRLLTAKTANGILTFSNMDVANAKGLFVQRGWEVGLLQRSHELLLREGFSDPKRDVVVDAGANIGMICIAMLTWGYFREALAFEPFPETFVLLERNVRQNGLENAIRAYPYALSSESGEATLEISDSNAGDQRVRATDPKTGALLREDARSTLTVPLRTLDAVLREASLDPDRIGLVWADIQGHEGHLFQGARDTLSHRIPVLTEFWPYGILRAGMSVDDYVAIVRSLFGSIIVVSPETPAFERQDPESIRELFSAHPHPDDQLELLLLPS